MRAKRKTTDTQIAEQSSKLPLFNLTQCNMENRKSSSLNCFCRSALSSFPLILLVDEGKNEQNQKDEQSNQNPGIHFDEGILMALEIPLDFSQILL